MNYIAIAHVFILLAFFSLFFDLWEHRALTRLLIWTANVLAFCWLSNIFAFITELQTNANEGNAFLAAMRQIMGIPVQNAVVQPLPEASTILPAVMLALLVLGAVWALLIAIALACRERMRFTRTLLFCCILFNLLCQTAYLHAKRRADGARVTMRYYQECKGEVERINALMLEETERREFFQKAMGDFRWTYEKASRNYESMERLLQTLKAFP